MGKTWALFFAANMIAMAGLCFAAPGLGWGLPEGVSTHAASVDLLFYIIFWITAFFFFLTEALLIVFMWKYGSGEKATHLGSIPNFLKPVASMLDSQHKVEMAWTIVPAAILLYIAVAQVGAWAKVKYQSRLDELTKGDAPIPIELSARQFEWRFRYPSAERMRQFLKDASGADAERKSFAKDPHLDDVRVVNELHIFGDIVNENDKSEWRGKPVLVHLSTRDVLHSFNLPHFRVKQDALPGKIIPVWFTPTKPNTVKVKGPAGQWIWQDGNGRDANNEPADRFAVWDIPCAELCGWGHWRMVGRVYVHPTQEDFLAWLDQAGKAELGKTAK